MTDFILKQAQALQDQMQAWRRDFHQHPELGFQETRTAGIVAAHLRDLGMEVEVGVGKTGVVGHLGDAGGPVIGIRADMDALPIQEANDVPYASQTDGVMHACGHDAHTAILMGVAKILNEMPDRPAGEIRFLFQPSEEDQDAEGKSGAARMIEDHALNDVDHVIALHVASKEEAGTMQVGDGYIMAAVDKFHATIKGQGGHGAAPHLALDPITIAAQVINAINAIRARRIDPTKPAVISFGSIHAGTASNVIPQEVALTGTIRSYDEETRETLLSELENAFKIAQVMGGDYELELFRGYPATYNDPAIASKLREVSAGYFGDDKVDFAEPIMGAEDFSYMTQAAPGAMLWLGVKLDEQERPHHNPYFDIDDTVLYQGAAILAETAVQLLRDAQ